jgi:hypothetical protein
VARQQSPLLNGAVRKGVGADMSDATWSEEWEGCSTQREAASTGRGPEPAGAGNMGVTAAPNRGAGVADRCAQLQYRVARVKSRLNSFK